GLHLLLIALTHVTTTWAGALHQGINLLQEPARFTAGLSYSLGLMAILGAHEMGHYVAAIWHGMRVTLPYFIPVPFALGTFGAFIQLRSPSPSRRALFDVGVAGPLAGLAVAVPALLIGLPLSSVSTAAPSAGLHLGTDAGSSMLLTLIASVVIPDAIAEGHVIVLHPLAFAGWLGLLVTALNLIPIGQLDGGHIADAMFGPRASATIATLAMVTLVLLGLFVWSGLLFWAFIAFFIAGRKGLPPLNDLTVLDTRRLAVGIFSFALLVAILLPVPHGLYETIGIHCPYL
ncbi:MAG: site-2 protease family protein, partial [Luteitalea sp.]|nr:site-2 protease family protein [Luteitalea sp.]